MRLTIDGAPIEARAGDTVLVALARAGTLPAGCLCLGGDCPSCLATIDGRSHLRMCQIPAREGMVVVSWPVDRHPPMPGDGPARPVSYRYEHCQLVVVGAGNSGSAEADRAVREGRSVMVIDAAAGDEALGLYPGPEVTARVGGDIVRIRSDEVVVATGRAELQSVAPGNHLAGILTPGAANHLSGAGVDLGDVVAVGSAPGGMECRVVLGTVVRFEGTERVEAVVIRCPEGVEERHVCDTVAVNLGTYPRDVLARMLPGPAVRVVGGAARPPNIPPLPAAGRVCPCSDVSIEDLDFVWDRGFKELELIKRATLAGTGTCQGGVCSPYLRSFVQERGGSLQPSFTARPLARQMTIGEAAAGFHLPPVHRTGLDGVHRAAGAQMDRVGGWWRPWRYPDAEAEYRAVREAVSLGDVGTLGKMTVKGPDAADFLERLYPCRVTDLAPGRSRYALVLAESGGLLDDGLVARVDDTSFALTFTTGGAAFAEAWVRDWAAGFGADVRIMDMTHSLGAINVTGPRAVDLLERCGLTEPMRFMTHRRAVVAGVDCRVYRLSFTGEASYELHHGVGDSLRLWDALMEKGQSLGVRPYGLHTLQTLRLEKGHVIVGLDTEPDSTPRRLGMEWAVKMDKPDFVGRIALERTDQVPLDRKLVGMTMEGPAPLDGAPVYIGDDIGGYVTSAAWSPVLGTVVMLAWVDLVDGSVPDRVTVDGRPAGHTAHPFYDPEGARARA